MRMILATLLLGALALPATAQPATTDVTTMATDDCARARKAGKTCVLSIDDETIEGTVATGNGSTIIGLDTGRLTSLIRLRRDFIPEILRSAEDID